jgi:hypothetical protein
MPNIFGLGRKSLTIRFIADTARASRKIDMLIAKLRKAQGMMAAGADPKTAAGKAGFRGPFGLMQFQFLDKLAGKFKMLGGAGFSAFAKIGIGAGIATAAVWGFSKLLKSIATSELGTLGENTVVQLKILTGNVKKAHMLTKEAMRFSMLTPFAPAEVVSATNLAVQFGFADAFKKGAYKLPKDKTFMDIAAGLASFMSLKSGQNIGMHRAVYAMLAGDYRLLRPVRGVVEPARRKAKLAGDVGTPEFNRKFVEELGKIPSVMNMAYERSRTVAGLWSTIAGFAEDFWIAFWGSAEEEGVLTFWSQFKDILLDIEATGKELMEWLRPYIVEFGAFIGANLKFVWDILKEMGRALLPVLIPLFKILVHLGRIFFTVVIFAFKAIARTMRFFANIAITIGSFISKITGIGDAIDKIVGGFSEFVTGLQIMFQFASAAIDHNFKRIHGYIQRFLGDKKVQLFFKGLIGLSTLGLGQLGAGSQVYPDLWNKKTKKWMKYYDDPEAWMKHFDWQQEQIEKKKDEENMTETIIKDKRSSIDNRTIIINEADRIDLHTELNYSGVPV